MLSVTNKRFMLSVIMLNVVMLNVVAPFFMFPLPQERPSGSTISTRVKNIGLIKFMAAKVSQPF